VAQVRAGFCRLTRVEAMPTRGPELTAQEAGPGPFGFAQGRLWATGPLTA
jgi:hypothetical protein